MEVGTEEFLWCYQRLNYKHIMYSLWDRLHGSRNRRVRGNVVLLHLTPLPALGTSYDFIGEVLPSATVMSQERCLQIPTVHACRGKDGF